MTFLKGWTALFHPDDIDDLPAMKAATARYGASLVVSPHCPRGTSLLMTDPGWLEAKEAFPESLE